MKRLLLLLLLIIPICVSAQKKQAKAATQAPTPAEMDSTLNTIYKSYDADRQILISQIQQSTDTTFTKALNFQYTSLENKCAERMWGYIIMQEPTDYTMQLMYRLRGSVDPKIVEASLFKIKDKELLQSKPAEALKYFVNNGSVKLGDKYRDIVLEALSENYTGLKLSDEVKSKNILLILGENEGDAIPAQFKKFYEKIDHSSIDVIQVKFFKDKAEAAISMTEKKEAWPAYADCDGAYSKVILDYNVVATPVCFLLEKGSGKILYEGEGVSDEIMGQMLTM